jgi:cytochrome P450
LGLQPDRNPDEQSLMTNPDKSPDLDPFEPSFIECPFPTYRELQAGPAATYVDHGKGFWLVSRHDHVREVVADVERFSSESGPLQASITSPEAKARMAEITPEAGLRGRVNTLLTLDPPGHTRNRRLISRAFTPAAVRRHEALIRETCRGLIKTWRTGTEIDFVADFAVPMPVRVIAHALDVPDNRVEDFKRWSDASVGAIGADLNDDQMVEQHRQLLELAGFLSEQIERKRAAGPAEDVMSKLVHAELTDDETSDLGDNTRRQLSDDEIHSIVRQILVAGNETTTNLLTQMMVLFSHDTQWWDEMRADPELIPAVVEEGLRYVTPSAANQRATTCPVDLGGTVIPEGDVVLVGYLAADHDPAVFPDPERFDPRRDNISEHMAFGRGIHFCPGASLARLEARVALAELTAAVASFDINHDRVSWNQSFQLRAMTTVPMTPVMGATTPQ